MVLFVPGFVRAFRFLCDGERSADVLLTLAVFDTPFLRGLLGLGEGWPVDTIAFCREDPGTASGKASGEDVLLHVALELFRGHTTEKGEIWTHDHELPGMQGLGIEHRLVPCSGEEVKETQGVHAKEVYELRSIDRVLVVFNLTCSFHVELTSCELLAGHSFH